MHAAAPLPFGIECFLPIGYTIRTRSLGLGAGSAWQDIVIFVVEC